MTPIERFEVLGEAGAPVLRSRLSLDGRFTGLVVPGKRLVGQYATERGYLLITDFDCPFEETTSVILLDNNLNARSWRSIGVLFSFLPPADGGFNLRSVEWQGPHEFRLHGHDGAGSYQFRIRRRRVPYLLPQLAMRRVRQPKQSA